MEYTRPCILIFGVLQCDDMMYENLRIFEKRIVICLRNKNQQNVHFFHQAHPAIDQKCLYVCMKEMS